jgi:epoxyqueuosine reductase
MTLEQLKTALDQQFDLVGFIKTEQYQQALRALDKPVLAVPFKTMAVVGLSYPKRIIKHTDTHLIPSFYTFGRDYHDVLKNRIKQALDPLGVSYDLGVDNHPHNERLAATLAGLGFMGKNQLIINQDYGSYMFLGLVFLDIDIQKPFVLEVNDSCGDCKICIDACPTNALYEGGYHVSKCMSHYNQTKRVLTDVEIEKNYALFGCDICQMVCPKNVNKGKVVHEEFLLSGKEAVSIIDLFTDSEKTFKEKYADMAYLWKGKTILMRNALMLLSRSQNTKYNDLIEKSIEKYTMPWYQDTAIKVLKKLKG